MFCYRNRQRDIERDATGPEILNFEESDWILDHHRHNLIQKIIRPETGPGAFYYIWSNTSPRDPKEYKNQSQAGEKIRDDHGKEVRKQEGEQLAQEVQSNTEIPSHEHLEDSRESYRINFCELQRMHLSQLQYTLVDHVVNLTYGGKPVSGWAEDLRTYVQALQDYDYMGKQVQPSRDPFYVTGERIVDRCMLNTAMRGRENPSDPLSLAQSIGQWEMENVHPEPVGGTRDENFQRAWITGFRQRVGAAVVGGIFLVRPMWLMVLHKTRYTALISTTVFVTVFGIMMALFLDKKMDVLSSTAAYAAVLVVFVGLNT